MIINVAPQEECRIAIMENGKLQEIYLERIDREILRLNNLIEDLLRLSRLDQGKVSLALKPLNLNRLIAQYSIDRRPIAESKGI